MEHFGGEALAELLSDVCAEHTQVQPTETYTTLSNVDERLRAVVALQQQARSLRAEIAARTAAEEQLRVALEAEQAAREAAEAALRARDEFLSVASHELRTPVSSLSTQAQLIRRRLEREGHIEPERMQRAVELMASQADRLSRLLGQLLDLTRVEGGRLQVELEPTPLAPLVELTVEQAQDLTDRHVITFEPTEPTAAEPLVARVDALRLEQVLTNLLDNAVKYSPEGGPIDVTMGRRGPTTAEIAVRDHGLGIPPDKRGRIFDRFFQAHEGAPRGGMGLGLYISRQIVELHGGQIVAEFPPDGGTRMVVRLPLDSST
jgi:signal transduction histidine kinase